MPHLYFRNKYWWIGGDDLVIPAAYSIIGRLFWEFFLAIVTYLDFHTLYPCNNGLIILVYLCSSMAVQFLMIVNDLCILCVSMRGTIIDIEGVRKPLQHFLYYRLLITYSEGFVTLLGFIGWLLSWHHLPCGAGHERTMINLIIFGMLLLSQVLDLTSITFCSYVLPKSIDRQGRDILSTHAHAIGVLDDEESILAKWEDRLNRAIKAIQFYGCNRYGGSNVNESLRNVARVFTRMFHHDGFLDVVPSDVLAGLILVRLEQFTNRNDAMAMMREQNEMRKHDPLILDKQRRREQLKHAKNIAHSKRLTTARSTKSDEMKSSQKNLKKVSPRQSESNIYQIKSRSSNNPLIVDSYLSSSPPISPSHSIELDIDSGNLGDEEDIVDSDREYPDMRNFDPTSMKLSSVRKKDVRHKKIALLPTGVLRDFDDVSEISTTESEAGFGCRSHRASRSDSDEDTATVTQERLEHIARYSIYAAAIYTRIVPFNSMGTKLAHKITNCMSCQFNRPAGVEMCWCCWFGRKLTGSTPSHKFTLFPKSNSIAATDEARPTGNVDGWSSKTSEDRERITPTPLEGIDFCGYNRAGLSVFTEMIDNSELVFVSFRNDMIHKPFAIFLDHHLRAVVITIRGTLSIEDGITDITCEPQEMTEAGKRWGFDGRGRYAHGGMLRAAQVMCEEIIEAKILEKIFGRRSYTENEPSSPFADYRLVLTGHSLGAGAAILLGWILRTSFPNVRCCGFGTPASVLDRQSCLDSKRFVTSIILGNDIISRLSLRSISLLRNQVLYAIARARAHKLYILSSFLRPIDLEKALYQPGKEPDSDFKQAYLAFKADMEARLNRPDNVELLLPGSILHFVKTKIDVGCCFNDSVYSIVHGRMEDYQEIPISATMRSDHHPDQYYHEMHRAVKHFDGRKI